MLHTDGKTEASLNVSRVRCVVENLRVIGLAIQSVQESDHECATRFARPQSMTIKTPALYASYILDVITPA